VVGGSHGDGSHPEAGETGVVIEEGAVFGVGVEEVERPWIQRDRAFDEIEKTAQDGEFEGVKEEGEGGFFREGICCGVGVVEVQGSEGVGS
jgi:hypothetical protein